MRRTDPRGGSPPVGRWVLGSVVLLYFGAILLGPLAALTGEVLSLGPGDILRALGRPEALQALRMTLTLLIIAVVVNAVVGVAGAIAVVRHRFPGRALVNALADLPLAISPVMIGLAFLLLLGRGGWLEPALNALHLKVVFAFPGVVAANLFVTLPFTLREVAYVLDALGTSDEEAAVTLGASPWQTFWLVTLPNIRLGLGYGLLMTTARSLGEFGAILVVGGSISGQTQTATTYIQDAVEERSLAGAYGMAALLALVSVCLLLALQWAKARREEVER
ncbi:MAG: sulfate ABC transporter permease subunit [Deltaproteobacteria bacterium]|nr:sulfate ABC transporter permease subunit [Deltaproteobacteria bacterium]